MKHLSVTPLQGRHAALSTNMKSGWKDLPVTNTLAYYKNPQITSVKSFIRLAVLVEFGASRQGFTQSNF